MNYEVLKSAVADVIKTNGNEEITGQLLQDVLMAIINALGSGYQFMGIATAETTPGTPDQRVFYLAGSAGSTVLPGFDITVDHEICVLMYSDEWEKQTLLQFDSALTSGSQNLVTSGMVHDAITNLSQAIDGLAQIVGEHTTAIESLQETVGEHTTAIDHLQYAVVAIQAAIESLQTDVAQKIDKSDADSLVVGSARGVLATSAVEAFFLFQQSGTTGDGAALIPTIKGKTLAWNQKIQNGDFASNINGWSAYGAASAISAPTWDNGRIKVTCVSATSGGDAVMIQTGTPISIIGHKYLLLFDFEAVSSGISGPTYEGVVGSTMIPSLGGNRYGAVLTAVNKTENFYLKAAGQKSPGDIWYFDNVIFVDLTLMFGADYEPSTVAEFVAFYRALYYAFNSGELKNNDAVAMITDGFNQWDEVWERGGISGATGQNNDTATSWSRSKNYNKIFPSTDYYLKKPANVGCIVHFYDSNFNYLGQESRFVPTTASEGAAFVAPSAAAYFRIIWEQTTYNNDICINLSAPPFNGIYEPYWTRTSHFGLTGITGIPEGGTEDDRVTIFPDGLAGAGSAFDSIFVENGVTKARRMMARVDLGDLTYSMANEGRFYTNISSRKPGHNTLSTLPHVTDKAWTDIPDGGYDTNSDSTTYVYFVNSNCSTPDSFKEAVTGVEFYYELATPIVYTDLQYADGTPFIMPQMFRTAQGGTMLIVSPEGATAPSAPFSADIIYPVDPIASSGASLKNLLEALKTATVITSYTMTFNSTTQQYEFTIVK